MAAPAETPPSSFASPPQAAAAPCRVLIWYWGRNGAGPLYALELMRTLPRQPGIAVSGSLAAGNALRAETETLGAPLQWVPTYHNGASFAAATLRLPFIRAQFQRFLRQGRFDIVLSTMGHLWTPLLVDCVTRSGAAYIPVLHDAAPHPGEAQPLWRWRRAREIRQARHVITLSSAVADGVAAATGYPRDHISVIPYGIAPIPGLHIETRRFPSARPFRFLFFGRIMAYKGLDILLSAFRIVQQAQPQTELCIAGCGDMEPYGAALDGLRGVTIINRWIAEDEFAGIFAGADAVILPYREASQSGVTSQAYAAGLPVIATPTGGLTEQITPGQTGFIAESMTPRDVAEAMLRLLDAPCYDVMAEAVSRHRAQGSFMAQGQLYADLFRRVMAERQGAA